MCTCSPRWTWALAAACGALALLAAAPARPVRSVELAAALNRTVCPMRVEIDDNPDRVPRRIKLMKCAPEPSQACRARLSAHECCERRHGRHVLECVEVHDTVLVYYRSSGATAAYTVAVGCSCMVERSATAPSVPAGPT